MTASVCVIFNPTAGRGGALRRLAPWRCRWGTRAEFLPTRGPGHAEELAFAAAQNGFEVVAAAGGDGTVHEVANGILHADRAEVAFGVCPIGSANDYAHSLERAECWSHSPLSDFRAVDVGQVRTPDGRARYFVNGLGLGFNGAVTIESRRIRRLQGTLLYGFALLGALWYRYQAPAMDVALDGQSRLTATLALSLAIGRREGNFVVAPHAKLDDGLFDYVHVGPLSRWELLRCVPGLLTGDLPRNHRSLWMGRCREVVLASSAPLAVHVDGEFFAVPEEAVTRLEIKLLPARLRVRMLRADGAR